MTGITLIAEPVELQTYSSSAKKKHSYGWKQKLKAKK